jgi:Protein of unknown function (DUF2865)
MNETAQPRVAARAIAATTIAATIAASLLAVGASVFALLGEPAAAQAPYPAPYPGGPPGSPVSPGGPPGYPGGRNPVCPRLEAQLVAIDRGNADPARAADIKRLEDQASRQQFDVDRVAAQARRLGCEGRGFFSLFGGQPQQCGPVNTQLQQVRANLDRTLGELQQLQGNTADREGQRRSVLTALGQNDCGPQYRAYANRGGFFENLFGPGPGTILGGPPGPGSSDTYRTLCVRTCDGYYFPISYATEPSRFPDDERTCQAMCPAAEVTLYTHRNPGEDVTQAISTAGRSYTELPTAFAYRKSFNPSCSCKAPGQTWADALKQLDDQTIERGDIVVNEERARQLSQPQTDAQGRPIRPPPKAGPAPKGKAAVAAPASSQPAEAAAPQSTPTDDASKRQVRSVGPTFLPTR